MTTPVGDEAKVLILTQRSFEHALAYTSWFEGEDVMVVHGGAALHHLPRRGSAVSMRARALLGRSLRRTTSRDLLLPPLAGSHVRGDEHYDVAVAVVKTIWDLTTVEAVSGLRQRASSVVGWFPEVWPSEIDDSTALLPFSLLDEIFVGEVESAQRLAELLDRPVHLLPLATDAVEFSDRWATRCSEIQGGVASPIDVLNIGRRDPALHQALLRWSRADERYYVFDTMVGARVIDHRVHRRALADQLQRTSAAISSYAKYGETGMEELRWVPARVFDNLASGTLLVGAPPHPASQRLLFGREVVHPLPEDPVEGAEVVAALSASPALLEREENMRIAMRGHDWSHRWISLLETCGHRPARTLLERRDRLRREAAEEGAARSDG